ncbi:SDR family NAD(P)-dependent oxidoreductase [Treponema sp.]|uniref:SDR family NAD(P)-dependent oxidoreductase n=1 Tax=Treponema sp. TaxID=166 RepID=UPI003FD7E975
MEGLKKNIAIVTGASSGFGKEFVKLLLKKDCIDEIWAVARNQEKLNLLKEEFGTKIRTVSADLSESSSFSLFEQMLTKEKPRVAYLVNNAGYGKFGSYKDLSAEQSINMMSLNMGAPVAAGLVCLPYMAKGGRIINIASQASFFPLPYMNIYSATKAFLRNYTRALNVELKGTGITATAVCPPWMKTNFFSRAQTGAAKTVTNFMGITDASKAAAKALKDADRGKDISVFGIFTKLTHFLSKIFSQKAAMKVWILLQRIK